MNHITPAVVGIVLLAAAVLKSYELLFDATVGHGEPLLQCIRIGAVVLELTLGLWLLARVRQALVRFISIATFCMFGMIALIRFISGADSCGCFGRVTVKPAWVFVLDAAIVIALLRWHPDQQDLKSEKAAPSRRRQVIVGAACLACVIASGWGMTNSSNMQSFDGKTGRNNHGPILLDPVRWTDQPFSLSKYIDIGDRFLKGRWTVVIYHSDCPKCAAAISKHRALASTAASKMVAFIEIPPFADEQPTASGLMSQVIYGRLSDRVDWVASTPIEVELDDGIVVDVSQAAR